MLLLFGGESSEHDVSISSARNVYAAINDDDYDVTLCYIDRHGKWWLRDNFDTSVDEGVDDELVPELGRKSFSTRTSDVTIGVDVILPILHGRNGEDGTVQGLAQLMHIPIVGCDVTASGTAMNKLACKEVMLANGIDVIPFVAHRSYEPEPDFAQLTMRLGCPLFVKPARAGSSVGVSKVSNEEEFVAALQKAHEIDSIALIEQAVAGRELEIALYGTPPHHHVSGVGEIIPGEDFYDYADKYDPGSKAQVHANAELDPRIKQQLRAIADKAYLALDCKGLARVDFMLDEDDTPYVMEINTMPGFTNISMFPKLWREEGVSYQQLIGKLIDDALGVVQ